MIPALAGILGQQQTAGPFSPTDISGLSGWLDASDTGSITGTSPVTEWADLSGNGNDAVQGTNNVVSGTRTINSLNALDFSGTTGLVWFQPSSNVCTIFMVAQSDVTGTNQRLLSTYDGAGGLTSGQILFDWLSTNSLRFLREAVSTSATATKDTAVHLFTAQNTSSASFVGFDGAETTGSGYATAPAVAYVIGQDTSVTTNSFNGLIAEILYYEAELSPSEITQVENYLADKWGFL